MGFLLGLAWPAKTKWFSRILGWSWYLALETLALAEKGFPFIWANVLRIVSDTPPAPKVELALGICGGVIALFIAGEVGHAGRSIGARIRNRKEVHG